MTIPTVTEADRQCARNILAGFVHTHPPGDFMEQTVANYVAAHRERDASRLRDLAHTPNADLPPLDPAAPTRKMIIEIEVAADFEERLDNQWMVEREIHADRWNWNWADPNPPQHTSPG